MPCYAMSVNGVRGRAGCVRGSVAGVRATLQGIPRDARLMLASMFCGSLPVGLLLVFLPLYLHDLGVNPALIGSVFTLAGIGASVLMMVVGPLADRLGRRPFLLAGTALPMLGFLIFASTTNTAWLVAAGVLGGVGFAGGLGSGLIEATFIPALSTTVDARRRTTLMSLLEISWTVAIGAGASLAGLPALLARARGVAAFDADRLLFVLCLLCAAAATALLLPVRADVVPRTYRRPAPSAPATPAVSPARLPRALVLKLAVFFGLQGAGLGLVVQLLPLVFALRFHATAAAVAPWFSLSQVAGLPLILL